MSGYTQSFRCPNCNEYINTDATECRFCGHPVDAQAALRSADEQEKINKACNDALNVRNLAGALWLMIGLRWGLAFLSVLIGWAALFSCAAQVASLIMFFGILAMLARWEIKYAGVRTLDPDFAVARRNWIIALALWIGALLLFFAEIGYYFWVGYQQSQRIYPG